MVLTCIVASLSCTLNIHYNCKHVLLIVGMRILSATTSTKLFTILYDNSKSVVPLDGPTQNSDHADILAYQLKLLITMHYLMIKIVYIYIGSEKTKLCRYTPSTTVCIKNLMQKSFIDVVNSFTIMKVFFTMSYRKRSTL